MLDRIPENILEEILSRVDIVGVISDYIPLKRSGRNFRALCPFHHEKTPSFMVSSDKQIYHCFGCGQGGNAFNFLIQYERMDFPEAVEVLAKKAGVVLPEKQKLNPQAVNLATQLYQVNESALLFFQNNLNCVSSPQARNYLLRRGLKEETIKLLKLGYALNKPDSLMNYLRSKSINLSLLEKAGLVVPKEGGGYQDRFRERIIFPIFDIKSRGIGFGARVMDNSLPKYVNSPETPIYIKGRNLYGLNLSRDAVREVDFVVVVEGYLDCIIPYQEGLHNIVASQGTAFTYEQARLIKRYTHNVVMVYDGDKAGQLATLRTLDIFIEEGMNVKVVSLPEGSDPDSFVRRNGIENFKSKMKQAESLLDYKLKVTESRYDLNDIQGKAMISAEILPTIHKFKNAILKSEYIKKIAQELDVKEEALLGELKKIKEDRPYLYEDGLKPKPPLNINPTEKLLLKLMLEEAKLVNDIREKLEPADFQDDKISKIVSLMFDLIEQGKNIELNLLMNRLDDDVLGLLSESTFLPEIPPEDKERIIDDCVRRLKNKRLNLKKDYLRREIKIAQEMGDNLKLEKLMQEFHHLIKKR